MPRNVALLLIGLLGCHPREQASIHTLRLVADLSLATADSGPHSFVDLRAFAVDGRGQFYVLEARDQEVRLFDSTGAFIRRLGRRGSGPGEFRAANGLAIDRYDQLWVYDPGNSRVEVFDSFGSLKETHLLEVTFSGWVWDGGVDTDGRLYNPFDIHRGDSTLRAVARFHFDRGTIDTLLLPKCQADVPKPYIFPRGMMDVPYAPSLYSRVDPAGYVWCGSTDVVHLDQYRLEDRTLLRTFTTRVTPTPVTPEERDTAIAQVVTFMKTAGSATPDLDLIPKFKPVLRRIDTDDRGNHWVQVATGDGFKALIFNRRGEVQSEILLPFRPSPWRATVIRAPYVYAATTDSLDVPTVSRFRIQ